MIARALAATLLAAALAACTPKVHFADREILWHWPDDRPVPQPKPRTLSIYSESTRDAVFQPADRVLALDYYVEARNTNALDDVPDSAWFRDPRRVDGLARPRPLTIAEVEHGALKPEDVPVLPFTITEGKNRGLTPGFVAVDARGVKYLVKLDPKGHLGLTTQTELVASRLAWASGYLVPALSLVDALPSEILLSPQATTKDDYGHKVPYDDNALRTLFDRAPRTSDGRLRLLASRWLPGVTIGEFPYFGRIKDDLNDIVRHEDRRDLRGFGIWAAWVNDIDTMQNNTLDMYEGAPGRGHVVHYQQDLGGSFGNFAGQVEEFWQGTETYWETHLVLASLFTLGLAPRQWDDPRLERYKEHVAAQYPELGPFEAARFEPRSWQPIIENPAFARQTRRDRYWGAKRVAAFDGREIVAAVAAGRYRPATAVYLSQVLLERRRKIAYAYFSETTPLDHFVLRGRTLCFDDLWVESGLGSAASYHSSEGEVRERCVALPARDGYRVVALRVQRAGERSPSLPVRVHVIMYGDAGHIVGIER
jgi:hypothetical protein